MEITRIFDLLENLKTYPPKDDMLALRKGPEWIKYSIDDYYRISQVYQLTIDRDSGETVEKKLVLDNHSKVMYDHALIPPEQIRNDEC